MNTEYGTDEIRIVEVTNHSRQAIVLNLETRQQVCLPVARSYLYNSLIIKELVFSLTAMVTNFDDLLQSRDLSKNLIILLRKVSK